MRAHIQNRRRLHPRPRPRLCLYDGRCIHTTRDSYRLAIILCITCFLLTFVNVWRSLSTTVISTNRSSSSLSPVSLLPKFTVKNKNNVIVVNVDGQDNDRRLHRSSLPNSTSAIYSKTTVAPTQQQQQQQAAANSSSYASTPTNNKQQQQQQLRGRVVYCGWFLTPHFLPDYQTPIEWDPRLEYTTDDVLYYSKNQNANSPRPCTGFESANPDHLLQRFSGTILYINGESYTVNKEPLDDRYTVAPNNRIFQIGAFEPQPLQLESQKSQEPQRTIKHQHTMPVHYMVLYHTAIRGHVGIEYVEKFAHTKNRNSSSNNSNSSGFNTALSGTNRRKNNGGIAYFATNCVPFRQEAARRLSEIVTVHHGSGCRVEGGNKTHQQKEASRKNFKFNNHLFADFKYCLVMENKVHVGYITEKIFNAFMGGCLPIYYGTREVFDIFHEDSFVFYDVENPQLALDVIRRLEANTTEYTRRVNSPVFKDGVATLETYFSFLPHIGQGTLNKRLRSMMGLPPLDPAIARTRLSNDKYTAEMTKSTVADLVNKNESKWSALNLSNIIPKKR